ncbi:MAG TPA: LytR C-terminal domain-containing protein, partial [Streptosporangiaceae bacterium]|nr:LytR C-terminal domain-containing protein [Streptosporangiaceae bacterium]
QSVNYIDEPQIQQQVSEAFSGSAMVPPTVSSVTVNVYNGSGTAGLAAAVSQDLVGMGYKAGAVEDSSSQSQPVQDDTEVFYGAGGPTEPNAQVIANLMGVQSATPLPSLPSGQVEVLLGSEVTAQAPGLEMFGADTVSASDYASVAEQDGESVPATVQAAANAGSQSDVPAYSQAYTTPAASAPSGSGDVSGTPGPSAESSSAPGKRSSRAAKKPASSSSSSSPPYGLTTCPY